MEQTEKGEPLRPDGGTFDGGPIVNLKDEIIPRFYLFSHFFFFLSLSVCVCVHVVGLRAARSLSSSLVFTTCAAAAAAAMTSYWGKQSCLYIV